MAGTDRGGQRQGGCGRHCGLVEDQQRSARHEHGDTADPHDTRSRSKVARGVVAAVAVGVDGERAEHDSHRQPDPSGGEEPDGGRPLPRGLQVDVEGFAGPTTEVDASREGVKAGLRDGDEVFARRELECGALVGRKQSSLAIDVDGGVVGADDTAVHIDGQRALLPADEGAALELAPGEHFVAITQTGFHPFSRRIDLRRGTRETLDVDLKATGQRAAAIGLLTTGGIGLTVGIVLGALAVDADRNSRDDAAGDFRSASGIVGVGGVAVLVAGGTLLILDEPAVPSAPTLTLAPAIGPRQAGAGLTARF